MFNIRNLTIELFNLKLGFIVTRTTNDAARLQVSVSNLGILTGFYGDLTTAGTWCYLANLYFGGAATCTPNVIKAITALRTQIEDHLSIIYGDIPTSVWNDDDRSTFGLATGAYAARTRPGVITASCHPTVKNLGGAIMKFACRSATDQSRASLAKDANGVQIAYIIVDQPHLDGVENPETVARSMVSNPEACTHKEFLSKATFLLEFGMVNAGRNLQYFLRWYNSKYPKNAGPWSDALSENIS